VAGLSQAVGEARAVEKTQEHIEVFAPHPRSRLRGFERIAVPLCDWLNAGRLFKWIIQLIPRFSGVWIGFFASRRWVVEGAEEVENLRPERGVVLVSNHRSFFDMYVVSALLYRRSSFMGRLFFRVRAKFFYTSPVGLLVNLFASGCSMWPPIFRDERKSEMNPLSLKQAGFALARKGAVLGYHPEGTRGKGPDPYEFLPAKRGVGDLLSLCHPDTVVLPFFIIGMGNDVKREIGVSIRGDRARDPIRVRFGTPTSAGEVCRGRRSQEVADHLLNSVIRELADADREQQQAP